MLNRPLISLTTDFGPGTQGVGIMHAVALEICPDAVVIDLAHNVSEYSVIDGARQMETCLWLPVGIHVCVVDPGVGSTRGVVAVATQRGDILVGPDNGVLLPASTRLGGFMRAFLATNRMLWRGEVSTTFHGRDIMVPVAAHIAAGTPLEQVGKQIALEDLYAAPYKNASLASDSCDAMAIHFNKYGTVTLNLVGEEFEHWVDGWKDVEVHNDRQQCMVKPAKTFSDVGIKEALVFADDYGRVGIARNRGSFLETFPLSLGQEIRLTRKNYRGT